MFFLVGEVFAEKNFAFLHFGIPKICRLVLDETLDAIFLREEQGIKISDGFLARARVRARYSDTS